MNNSEEEFWSEKLSSMIAELSRLTAEEFLDARNGAPCDASRDLDELYFAFAKDSIKWKQFMDANPRPRMNWLPRDPAQVDALAANEIYYRLGENVADERWVDDALIDAFESGSLIRALERLRSDIASFELKDR